MEAKTASPWTYTTAARLVENNWPTAIYDARARYHTVYGKTHTLGADGRTLCGKARGVNWSTLSQAEVDELREACPNATRKNMCGLCACRRAAAEKA